MNKYFKFPVSCFLCNTTLAFNSVNLLIRLSAVGVTVYVHNLYLHCLFWLYVLMLCLIVLLLSYLILSYSSSLQGFNLTICWRMVGFSPCITISLHQLSIPACHHSPCGQTMSCMTSQSSKCLSLPTFKLSSCLLCFPY